MSYATDLDGAWTRQEVTEIRDADAEAIRELWEIARKKEQARRHAQRGEIPVTSPGSMELENPCLKPCP